LLADLDKSGSQVFVTTHSPTVLRAARNAKLWYVDFKGSIGRLADTVRRHQQADPETFLSRLAIVAEGKTEKGFLIHLLKRAIGDLLDHGIWITDGGGNDPTLQLLQDLSKSGLAFAGFADDEGTSRDKWKALEKALGPLLFRWSGGSLEQTGLVPEFETRD
jgi:putative ATP-dependent endonuclease of OLD family